MVADSCQQFCSQLSADLSTAVSSSALSCQQLSVRRFLKKKVALLLDRLLDRISSISVSGELGHKKRARNAFLAR
jgi:hypothetical protein